MSDPRMIPTDEAKAMRELLPGDLDRAEYDVFDRMAKWLPYYKTYAAAPDLAHTVVEQAARIEQLDTELRARAADTLEYRIEHQHIENGMWHPLTQWSPEWPLNDGYSVAPDERIVCRRVSHPWEVTDG